MAAGGAGFGVAAATTTDSASSAPIRARSCRSTAEHQAGIATPAQDRVAFAAFDVTATDPMQLQIMLGLWAAAAARMTAGQPIGTTETAPQAPPVDTGEALGLSPAQLTITVGFGPSLFDQRFGLAAKRPAALVDLPPFAGRFADCRPGRAATSACRPAPTTRSSRST